MKARNSRTQIETWKEHTVSLFGRPLNIAKEPVQNIYQRTLYIYRCVKSLRNGTALGLETIPIKVWKTDSLTKPLIEVSDKAEIWDKIETAPFPQNGELRYAKQYRD